VTAMTDVINFLLGLMGDEAKQAEFEQNPDKALQDAGLDGLTGQDVREAQLEMADRGLVRSDGGGNSGGGGGGGGSHRSGSDDAVREINHTTQHYHVTEAGPQIIQIDDRDTIFNDSFNSDDDVTIIDDSFNDSSTVENDVIAIQDNDTIVNDNDTVDVEDNDTEITETGDTGTGGPENTGVTGPGTTPPVGIGTSDLVETQVEPESDPEPELDPEPVEAEAPDAEPETDPEPELEADVEPLDTAAV